MQELIEELELSGIHILYDEKSSSNRTLDVDRIAKLVCKLLQRSPDTNMIILKSKQEIEAIHKACQVVAECHRTIAPLIKPGITTNEIERIFEDIILKHGANPYTKGYKGYQ